MKNRFHKNKHLAKQMLDEQNNSMYIPAFLQNLIYVKVEYANDTTAYS